MNRILRVLHIEDSELDVELLRRDLTGAGYALISERVETPAAMRTALETKPWDVILCDYSMPQFNAPAALNLVKEMGFDIPFIIISGKIGEEVAVKMMQAGAHDYLLKDNLVRLVPAIERQLEEAKNRRDRRRAEASLKASEMESRALFAAMTDVIFVLDSEGRYLKIAPTNPAYLYQPSADLLGKTLHEVFPERQADGFLKQIRQALDEGQRYSFEYSLAINGLDLWFDGSVSPITKDSVLWIARDISERKRIEQELRKSEERYRDLVENARDIIYTHDLEGNYTSVNKASEQITGYTREEALSMNLLQTVAPGDLEKARQMIAKKLAGEEEAVYELEIIAKDKRRLAIEVNTRLVFQDGLPVGVQGIARDITERKQLEEQLRQSQKLEAVGQLAGGIAHDFNNLLTAITGYSQLTLRSLHAEDPLRENIVEIKKAGDRAAALTRQLLTFSRKQVLQPVVLDLNSLVSEIEKMLRRLIGEDIGLRTVLAPGLGRIKGDPGQIEQVLMNLVVNARDAMLHGGKLTIETQNIYLDKEYGKQHIAVIPGSYVMLAVSDTGIGMDEQTKARIFEPFFTTKEPGKGTGLGLSTVYGIVKQSGGTIWVYSEIGQGTTFKVYFPRVDKGTEEHKRSPETEGSLLGTETILLAEDEEIVRKLVSEVLKSYGYQVLEADNGGAALLICERHKAPIHLLVSDAIMPEMSGRELAGQLAQLRPEMKVLFMSGYTDNAIQHQGVIEEKAHFIQKPFSPDALAYKVREVLDETR
jgi:two-component system, cell cycle sensor histidine kinase and response regulator CckA